MQLQERTWSAKAARHKFGFHTTATAWNIPAGKSRENRALYQNPAIFQMNNHDTESRGCFYRLFVPHIALSTTFQC